MKFLFNSKKILSKAGFSLIELLVVLAIFIIITSVVLARQNKFSSDILLTDLAYQVAISIRQAQVYGLGVRAADANYDTGYGIHFEGTPNETSYKFFADSNPKDGIAESVEINSPTAVTYQLEKGQKITQICVDSNNCMGQTGISSFNIIYIRPDPAANITHDQNPATYSQLVITVASALGDRFKCVTAYQTGQVSVSNPNPAHLGNPNPCL